ncbi:MAG: hypothetical protein A2Y73_00410, partial [Chloroflexi bacterium RBG_13_56_8]
MERERAILRQARKLDPQALAKIYDHFSVELYRYAVRQLGDPTLAEDCVADTFRRFLQALQQGGGPNRYLRAYLYRVAHNWITDQYRCEPSSPLDQAMNVPSDTSEGPVHQTERSWEGERVRAALAQLTPDQRQVIVL